VNTTTPVVKVDSPQRSYKRQPRRDDASIQQWVVDSSSHVFEAARPWQTAFCPPRTTVDWAAAPGTYVAAQLALLTAAGDMSSVNFTVSDLAAASNTIASPIPGSSVELSQVGLVKATSCPVEKCGGRAYSPELASESGWYPDILQPLEPASGYSSNMELRANHTRAVHISLLLPANATAGDYQGWITVGYNNGAAATRTRIHLTVWPIAAACVAAQTKAFGAAYGFDHDAVRDIYGPSMIATMEEFTAKRHLSSNSLDLWEGGGSNVTQDTVRRLLDSQDQFLADSMYLVPGDRKYLSNMTAPGNKAWVDAKLDAITARMAQVKEWGFSNNSVIYGPDELPPSTAPGINYLFGEVKKRWPSTKRMAVINWPAQDVMENVDILVFQYQEELKSTMAASRDAYLAAGKHVWGYHCVSPTPDVFLNSFIDVPLMKSRLIPWLASATNLTGWLYWFINFGWRDSPTAKDPATGKYVALHDLNQTTGHSIFDPRQFNTDFYSNSDGNWIYPGQHGPLSSLRLEAYRQGLEDRALLALLTPPQRLKLSALLVRSATNWTIDGDLMETTRRAAAALIGERDC